MDTNPDISELLCTMLRAGRRELALALIMEPDIDLSHRSRGGQTPLHIAAGGFVHGMVALLLVKGADPNAIDDKGRSPLMYASKVGDEKSVDRLLKHGADPNLATRSLQWTALMWASRHQNLSVLSRLLESHADQSMREARGRTAADIARQYGCAASLSLLTT